MKIPSSMGQSKRNFASAGDTSLVITLSVKPWRMLKHLLNSLPTGVRLKITSGHNQGDLPRISISLLDLKDKLPHDFMREL